MLMTGFTHSQTHRVQNIFGACLFQLSACFFGWWRDKFSLKSGEPLSTRMSGPWLIQISWILRPAKTSSQGWHSTFKRNKVTKVTTYFNNLYQHKTPSLVTVLLVPWIPACGGLKKVGKAQSNHSRGQK